MFTQSLLKLSPFFALIAALLAAPFLAHAQPAPTGDWDIKIGLGGAVTPDVKGVDEHEFNFLPYFDFTYQDKFYINPRDGVGIKVPSNVGGVPLDLKIGVGFDWGQDTEDAGIVGIRDVDVTPELRVMQDFDLGLFEIYGGVGMAFLGSDDGHEGMYAEAGIKTDFMVSERTQLQLGMKTRYTDSDWNQSFYGVTGQESANSGLAQYTPEAGFESVEYTVGLAHFFTRRIVARGFVNYEEYFDAVKDSPFTTEDGQMSGGFFVGYQL